MQDQKTSSAFIGGTRLSFVTFVALLLLFLSLGIWVASPYLLTLVMGGILAILFRPFYLKLLAGSVKPGWAAGLVTLAIFFLVLAPLTLFSILSVKQGISLAQEWSDSSLNLHAGISYIFRWPYVHAVFGDEATALATVKDWLSRGGKWLTTVALGFIANLPLIFLEMILALVSCFYFLLDGTRFQEFIRKKFPLDADVRQHLSETIRDTAISTTWSALAGAVVQAGLLVIGFLVTGVPAVFVAGGVAFLLAWVPILGSIPVWLAGLGYLLSQKATLLFFVLLLFGIAAAVADNIVRPWILKGRGNMHALVGLIAIFGGLDAFGMFGIFYGPMLAAVVLALLEVWPSVSRRVEA